MIDSEIGFKLAGWEDKFHRLWTQAVGQVGYDKRAWEGLFSDIRAHIVSTAQRAHIEERSRFVTVVNKTFGSDSDFLL